MWRYYISIILILCLFGCSESKNRLQRERTSNSNNLEVMGQSSNMQQSASSKEKEGAEDEVASENSKLNIKVYIENSGSMGGYVKGVTDFENSIYSYLTGVRIKDFSNSLNLHYINNKLISQGDLIDDNGALEKFICSLGVTSCFDPSIYHKVGNIKRIVVY